jgi:hypothetical protein
MAQAGPGGTSDDAMTTKEENRSFLKKRTKKLLFTVGCGIGIATSRRTKSFLLLFFKKAVLADVLATPA